MPPKSVLVSRAKKIPVARIQPPHLSSCAVPSSAAGAVADERAAAGVAFGCAARRLGALGAGCSSGGVPGCLLMGTGWVAWAKFIFVPSCLLSHRHDEHEPHNHSGDGDVEPEREGDPRQT